MPRRPVFAVTAIIGLLALSAPAGWASKFAEETSVQAKPLSPAEAQRHFRLEDGLRIELVAAEPLVTNPVDITFDENGRLFVAETVGYNAPDARPRSRIRLLTDPDSDGRMQHSVIFADDLDYAQGVLAMDGGLLVTTNSGLLFLRDRDGDGKADQQDVVFRCNPSPHVDQQMASPRRGLDNWIYVNRGLDRQVIYRPHEPERKFDLGTSNLRFQPGTGQFERSTGSGQFGNTFDDWGHQFFTVNRNPAIFAVIPQHFLARNPAAFLTVGQADTAPSGGESRVYPLKTFRTTSSAHAGTFTAACGISAYRGDLLGPAYADNLFVCEPTGELVSRWLVEPAGASLQAHRPQAGKEFLASDDEWFRPVNTATGPDGALYIVDMYRRFIDGARYFPDDFVAANDMAAGKDRGRIYRIVPKANSRRRTVTPLPKASAARIALLGDPNGWVRDTAQRLLVEAKDASAIPALETFMRTTSASRGRLHALWTIEGLGGLKPAQVLAALDDPEPGVVENALWLANRLVVIDDAIFRRVLQLTTAPAPRMRFAALLVAGERTGKEAVAALRRAAIRDVSDPWMRTAILSSPATKSGALLADLVGEHAFASQGTRDRVELAQGLAMILSASGSAAELKPCLALLSNRTEAQEDWWKMAIVSGMADGLRRQTAPRLPTTLRALLAAPPAELIDSLDGVGKVFASATGILQERDRPVGERLAAIPMLEHVPPTEAIALATPLLSGSEPLEIQRAALAALIRLDRKTVSPALYARLNDMGAETKMAALQFLQRDRAELLRKIKAGAISPALVGAETRWYIANSNSPEIRALGQEIFGRTEGDRKTVVRRYATAMEGLQGSAAEGHKIFLETCSVCHRVRGEGNDVGPDISDVRVKSKEMLLGDILDPSAAIEPRFELHTVKLKNGQSFSGIVASESNDAIVLKGPGWQENLRRSDVVSSESLGISLMPPGLEANLPEQKMASLLAFLRGEPEAR